MSQNRQVPKLRDLAFDALAKQGLFRTAFEVTEQPDMPLDIQQNGISSLVIDIARERLLPRLLQAVVNDDRKTVIAMLDQHPELLLFSPIQNCVIENESTWQKFYAEDALTMAVKLKQIKMTELLLSYYERLEQTDEVIDLKKSALLAWKPYEIIKDEIIIPNEYECLAESLVNVFREEVFPNGIPGRDNVPWNIELSEQTELAQISLLNILIPKKAVELDQHIDVELFLLAVYKAFVKNFATFNDDWGKLDAFCIRVIGITQTALAKETGKIFCEGLDDVVTAMAAGKAKDISPQAESLRLKGGQDLYRISRDSREGCGVEFWCGIYGGRCHGGRQLDAAAYRTRRLEKLCQAKTTNFRNIMQQSLQQHHPLALTNERSGCVML